MMPSSHWSGSFPIWSMRQKCNECMKSLFIWVGPKLSMVFSCVFMFALNG